MNKQTQVIGNGKQEKQIDRLLRQAGRDKLVKWVLDGKPDKKYAFNLNLFSCNQATWLHEGIIEEIGLEKDENKLNSSLVHCVFDKDPYRSPRTIVYSVTDASALLAVQEFAYSLAYGETMENHALGLLSGIELYAGFDKKTGLVRCGNNDVNLYTSANAALALANLAFKEKDPFAQELLENIDEHIGFDKETGLVQEKIKSSNAIASDSALLSYVCSILGRKEDALRLVEAVEEYIGFDKGLVKHCKEKAHTSLHSADNAALALAYFALGRTEEANNLIKNIESVIGFTTFEVDGQLTAKLIKRTDKNPDLFAYSSAMLALAYMAQEYRSWHTEMPWEDKK